MNIRSLFFAMLLTASVAAQDQPAIWLRPNLDTLTPVQWKQVDDSVDRGLAWLAAQQGPDGSFPSRATGQPAVTSFGVMAFMSRGHCPGVGRYGETINKAIDFVLAQQREDGMFYGAPIDVTDQNYASTRTATYNHAITGLMLCEAYGMCGEKRSQKLRPAIEQAIVFARQIQRRSSPYPRDHYGWRYLRFVNNSVQGEADLSVTAWFLMFYRSAKNAEFDVPQDYVDDAIQFVRCCYVEQVGAFYYGAYEGDHRFSRAMTGAGLLSLTMAGKQDENLARASAQWILEHPFNTYNSGAGAHDRYHYGAYYCSQAMFMLGGDYWEKFYPSLAGTLIRNQSADGSWQPEGAQNDAVFGNAYTTAVAILALTPPYQLLPIYQR